MIRTQIYLTDQQRSELAMLSKSKGKKQSELIREAIDYYLGQTNQKRRAVILQETAGIWKNRNDLPDFEKIRSEWDRN
jgi:predicted DNA-binding protein